MKKYIAFVIMLLAGAGIGYVGAKFLFAGDPEVVRTYPKAFALYFLLAIPFLHFLVVGGHELGHVVAGLRQNFQFRGLTVGPFSWKTDEEGKIVFRWNWKLNLAGGVAIMLPRGGEDLRTRFMWFAAGGPMASLLICGVLYLLAQLLPEGIFLRFLFQGTAMFSLAIFVATILPFRAGGFASDGLRILTFARNGEEAAADLAGLQAISHIRAGSPYATFPIAEMTAVAENPAIPMQQRVTMDYYRYLYTLATGSTEEAAVLLEGVMNRLDTYPPGTHDSFYAEQALFEAKYRKDLPAAEKAFAQYKENSFTEALSVHLVKAAMAELRGDQAALVAELPGIEKGLASAIDQSRVPIIKEWLAAWHKATA